MKQDSSCHAILTGVIGGGWILLRLLLVLQSHRRGVFGMGDLGNIYDLRPVSPVNPFRLTCNRIGSGCMFQMSLDSNVTTDNALTFCGNAIGWAPINPTLDFLTVLDCGSRDDCSVQCSMDCDCTRLNDGTDCPVRASVADITALDQPPVLPESACSPQEQLLTDEEYSAETCSTLMLPLVNASFFPTCFCTYVFCNGEFIGCGDLEDICPLPDCVGTRTRCVISDLTCPLAVASQAPSTIPSAIPSQMLSFVPSNPPSGMPSAPPTTAAPTRMPATHPPTLVPPPCFSQGVTSRASCENACIELNVDYMVDSQGRSTCICSSNNGILICQDRQDPPTESPTSSGVWTTPSLMRLWIVFVPMMSMGFLL